MTEDWHSRVYGREEFPNYSKAFWKLRPIVYKLDEKVCQSCFKKLEISDYSVHHIIPKSEGSEDKLENLILLCKACHDRLEGKGLNRLQITGFYYSGKRELETKERWPANFHLWVYGSEENPFNDNAFVELRRRNYLVQIENFWYMKRGLGWQLEEALNSEQRTELKKLAEEIYRSI